MFVLQTESFPKNVSSTLLLRKLALSIPSSKPAFLAIKLSEISVSVIVLFRISAVHTALVAISDAHTEFAHKSDAVRLLFATSAEPTLFALS